MKRVQQERLTKASRIFFLSFFISYLTVLIINLAAFAFVYYNTYRDNEKKAISSVRFLLSRGKDLLEARLEEIEDGAQRLAGDSVISNFMRVSKPLDSRHYYTLWTLSNEFPRYNLKNTFVDSVYLIFKESGVVLSTFYVNPDFVAFYPHFINYNEMSYDEWSRRMHLWSGGTVLFPSNEITIFNRSLEALTYMVPIVTGENDPKATLLALVPEENVRLLFQEIIEIGCRLTLKGPDEGLLLEQQPEHPTDFRAAGHPITVVSDENGMTYTAYLPQGYVARETRPVTVMYLSVLGSTILACLVTAAILALRNSKPLAHLFGILSDGTGEDITGISFRYSWLEESMEKIIGEKISIEKALERHQRRSRTGFYERLLRGGYDCEHSILEEAGSLDLDFGTGPWIVALIRVNTRPNEYGKDVSEVMLHSYINSYIKNIMPEAAVPAFPNTLERGGSRLRKTAVPGPSFGEIHIHTTNEGFCLITSCRSRITDRLSQALDEVFVRWGIVCILGLGKSRGSLMELKDSFDEAYQAIRGASDRSPSPVTVRFETAADNPSGCVYDFQDEQRLINSVLTGDIETMHATLSSIRTKNFDGNSPSTTAVHCLFADISATVVKIVTSAKAEDLIENPKYIRHLNQYTSMDSFFRRVEEVLTTVCASREETKKSHNESLKGELVEYIETHFEDPMICPTQVADAFGINHQYMSRFLKEQAGESFAVLLENVRMARAVELMFDSHLSLKDIGERVGYLSWNSFYKAFRRHYGVSPGKYRERKNNTWMRENT